MQQTNVSYLIGDIVKVDGVLMVESSHTVLTSLYYILSWKGQYRYCLPTIKGRDDVYPKDDWLFIGNYRINIKGKPIRIEEKKICELVIRLSAESIQLIEQRIKCNTTSQRAKSNISWESAYKLRINERSMSQVIDIGSIVRHKNGTVWLIVGQQSKKRYEALEVIKDQRIPFGSYVNTIAKRYVVVLSRNNPKKLAKDRIDYVICHRSAKYAVLMLEKAMHYHASHDSQYKKETLPLRERAGKTIHIVRGGLVSPK